MYLRVFIIRNIFYHSLEKSAIILYFFLKTHFVHQIQNGLCYNRARTNFISERIDDMRRKNLMAALLCTFAMTAASIAPMAVMAEETETVTEAAETSAEEETQSEEAQTEDTQEDADGEAQTDTEADGETEALPERPDYQALDYVTLGEYKGLTVADQPIEVTEDQIDEVVRQNIQLSDAMETVTEGAVEDGDTANIDYEGKLNGEAFDGGTAKGYDLVIGSDSFIDGFEDGLIGVAVGETIDLPLTFPENYGNADLAGKEVVFTVTVNEIKRMPELTDELASTISDGEYTDVAGYRDSVRTDLEAQAQEQRDTMLKSDLLTQVAGNSKINEYPQEMVDYGVANMDSYYRSMAEQYSMDFEEFLSSFMGLTEEDFSEQLVMAAQQNLQQELYLKAIAETEGIEVTDEDLAAAAQDFGFETAEEFIAAYGEDVVRISVLQDKTLDFLLDNAVIEEAQADTEGEEGETEAAEAQTEAPADEPEEADSEVQTEAVTEAATEEQTAAE